MHENKLWELQSCCVLIWCSCDEGAHINCEERAFIPIGTSIRKMTTVRTKLEERTSPPRPPPRRQDNKLLLVLLQQRIHIDECPSP